MNTLHEQSLCWISVFFVVSQIFSFQGNIFAFPIFHLLLPDFLHQIFLKDWVYRTFSEHDIQWNDKGKNPVKNLFSELCYLNVRKN